MRFGLFYEHQLPRPWAPDAEERALRDALEQVELADRLGIDFVWEVEHHFLEEYAHSSAPEVFLAAASQRTSRIRLGHGIVQLPPPFNHPVRVAERIATLDLLSGGRVEFGTGQASSQMELGGFGVDREAKHDMWEESLDAITRMFVEDPFAGYEGRFVHVPPRNVIPKPKQVPHPPLWMACSRRESIVQAARKGLGALSFSFVEPEDAKEWTEAYFTTVASSQCVPAGFSVNPSFAVVVPFLCHRDEETAIERGIDGAHFFGYSLSHYYIFGEHRPGKTSVWDEFEEHRAEYGFAREIIEPRGRPLGIRILEQGLGSMRGAIGTPAQVTGLLERYEAAGVDQVIFVAQAGPNRHEHVCESLELFAADVLPRFADQADQAEARKRERLGEAMRAALARRRPARRAPEGYVVTSQGEPAPARPAPVAGPHRKALGHRVRGLADAALARVVRGRSDRGLERMFGSRAAQQALFRAMARRFEPRKAHGFSGDIQYELGANGAVRPWTMRVRGGRALVRPGPSPSPAVVLRAPVPVFIRILAQELSAARAAVEGRLEVEGDVTLAARLGEMFGQPSPY
jgi:alkanesulfonate monooxygenase SsuD/methylene tetrahydromethanopterin reductase-like flavin-dependent oxidoreductase (luciferase family)/putative sterol carrier protein